MQALEKGPFSWNIAIFDPGGTGMGEKPLEGFFFGENHWHHSYCDEQMDPCPITEFIDECDPKHQVKIHRFLSLLEEIGPTLPRPYAEMCDDDGIHGLRIKTSDEQVRMRYFFCLRKFIVF